MNRNILRGLLRVGERGSIPAGCVVVAEGADHPAIFTSINVLVDARNILRAAVFIGEFEIRRVLLAVMQIGATYLLTPTTQLDAGGELGLSRSADDYRVFLGWSHRF